MQKAQLSSEFIIVLSIVLMVFLFFLSTIAKRSDDYIYNKRLMDAKELNELVSTQINTIFIAGHGTSTKVMLPPNLKDSTNYTISIYPSERIVEITWMSKNNLRYYTTQILTSNISGKTTQINSEINLTNIDGGILIGG